ncbi:MAG: aspartate-semialdehyde dehydrogenase [Phascolarctobacterium sp.]|jgi:aspartate-semialdehyde dehydrogenase|nr:aspartate-semialdehyde dehydrogenase [Phascolarctobacterium sp.]MBQ5624558.1 aspartate-semialdehyde dehydrogenase [Phascolarctobacterium sp.]MBQ5672905.1 aspartate-semialdehyde dehydrogenase [Phascolarctobacterium sp.]MBQ6618277.1 aspartate-semialdehyde dehydrogenase [Phascolarctobacterium sp.]
MKKYNVAILGATGAVGGEFLKLIEERNFPFAELRLLASKRSAGTEIEFMGKTYVVQEATKDSFQGIDIALFAGGSVSKEFAPYAVEAGAVVIDNSSTFRMDPEVPLVVPEVNPQAILKHKGIIANPNCSTIIMVMALKPLYDLAKIKRVVVSTYQAVSGAGKEGIDELTDQVKAYSEGKEMVAKILPSASLEKHYPIAFNLIPQIDVFLDNLYTKEEMKMINETQKIMEDYDMRITATTVRVPVYRSHSESVNIEFEHDLELADMIKAIEAFPGVQMLDNPQAQEYPMPLYTSDKDDCFVGRLRRDESNPNTFNLWVVGDQIRKGAALNTLQIAETMIKNEWI